jgi:hypothetical protein
MLKFLIEDTLEGVDAMTTITLEVPNELAARLFTRRDQLPQLLSMALDLFPVETPFIKIRSYKEF